MGYHSYLLSSMFCWAHQMNSRFSEISLIATIQCTTARPLRLQPCCFRLEKRLERYRTKIVKAARRFTHDVDVAEAAFQTFSNLCREKVFDSWRVNKMRLSGVFSVLLKCLNVP